mgnify:FL=1|tara:strand:- start:865 stop:1356 length:492 start_codon:yes stop_codon:yes gene_type:complete
MDTSKVFFNQAIPGESITRKLGQFPFDNPPLISSPVEAMEFVLERYLSNNTQDEILKLIIAGVTIEFIVNNIVKMGFMEGIFTVDVAEIIKPALLLHILADAKEAGVKNIKIMNDSKMPEISAEDFVDMKNQLRADEMEEMPKMMELPEIPENTESFLDMENI